MANSPMANVEGESHGAATLDAAIPLDGYVAVCEYASIRAARLRYLSRISGTERSSGISRKSLRETIVRHAIAAGPLQ